jgi:hypothetical protein
LVIAFQVAAGDAGEIRSIDNQLPRSGSIDIYRVKWKGRDKKEGEAKKQDG